jgi:hypothetical protein
MGKRYFDLLAHLYLLVSEDVKEALKQAGLTGVKFTEVSGKGKP